MDLLKTIKSRRSIRKYKPVKISQSLLIKILKAGSWAPSGLNNQPWKFLILQKKEELDGLSNFTHYANIIKNAPCAICIFLDLKDSYDREKDILALGACIQNMLLVAHSLGISSCWLGEILKKKKEVRRFYKLGKNLELFAVITLGKADQQADSERKDLDKLVIKLNQEK